MLSCKEVSRLVSDSLDRDLPFMQRLAVRIHLMMCRTCSAFRRRMQFLRTVVSHATPAEADPSLKLSPEAKDRIKRQFDEGDLP